MPFENWGHKCRYVFVDIHTRTIAVVKGAVPSTNISELKELRAQKRELITTLTKHVITEPAIHTALICRKAVVAQAYRKAV